MLLPKKRKSKWTKPMCTCIGIFANQEKKMHFYSIFFLFWEENILVGLGRKHLGPTIYFPSFPPNQIHSKKVFFPIFSSKFSIHPVLPPNKHILRLQLYTISLTLLLILNMTKFNYKTSCNLKLQLYSIKLKFLYILKI